MVSTRPLISKFSNPFINPWVTVPKASLTISINVTFIFHSFFSSQVRSMYLFLFLLLISLLLLLLLLLYSFEGFSYQHYLIDFPWSLTAGLLKSPGLSSVFWSIIIMLLLLLLLAVVVVVVVVVFYVHSKYWVIITEDRKSTSLFKSSALSSIYIDSCNIIMFSFPQISNSFNYMVNVLVMVSNTPNGHSPNLCI